MSFNSGSRTAKRRSTMLPIYQLGSSKIRVRRYTTFPTYDFHADIVRIVCDVG